MAERLALVCDSGAIPPEMLVGGIPLAARHVRMAARHGITTVHFATDTAERREALRAVLDRWALPANVEVAVVEEPKPPENAEIIELQANALYTDAALANACPQPAYVLKTPDDLPGANRHLFSRIRKSVALDGVISYYVMRPLARVLTRALLNTPVSPNMATLSALACGLGAAVLAALGGADHALGAGLLYWLGGVIDHVDGELARLRLQSSKAGEWLDSMTDEASTFTLLAGLGMGLRSDGYGDAWLLLGLGGTLVGALAVARLYVDLHRLGLPIDTAQFPWFFADTKDSAESGKGGWLEMLGFVLRRDANVTVVSLLVLFDFRRIAACTIAAAALIGAVVVVTHYAVTALRKNP